MFFYTKFRPYLLKRGRQPGLMRRLKKLRIFTNCSLFLVKIFTLGFMAYSVWSMVEAALGGASGLGAPLFWCLIAAIAVVSDFMVWKVFRLIRTPKSDIS